jgi:hypothetical protein
VATMEVSAAWLRVRATREREAATLGKSLRAWVVTQKLLHVMPGQVQQVLRSFLAHCPRSLPKLFGSAHCQLSTSIKTTHILQAANRAIRLFYGIVAVRSSRIASSAPSKATDVTITATATAAECHTSATTHKLWQRIAEIQYTCGHAYLNDCTKPEAARLRACAACMDKIVAAACSVDVVAVALQASALRQLGLCHHGLGEWDAAVRVFMRLERLEQASPSVYRRAHDRHSLAAIYCLSAMVGSSTTSSSSAHLSHSAHNHTAPLDPTNSLGLLWKSPKRLCGDFGSFFIEYICRGKVMSCV